MADMDLTLQGVPLVDDRWAQSQNKVHTSRDGVWEPTRGTDLESALPGFVVTETVIPGQHGVTQAQHAPIADRVIPIQMKFWAIDTHTDSPTYQLGQDDRFSQADRRRLLMENQREFQQRTQLGAAGSRGLLLLSAQFSNGLRLHARGRVTASSDAETRAASRYRVVDYLFRNPTGTWFADTEYRSATITESGTNTGLRLPAGDMDTWDAKIAVRPDSTMSSGSRFLNELGIGFEVMHQIPGGTWTIFDAGNRRAGQAGTGSSPEWDAPLEDTTLMAEYGPPQGSMLNLPPGIAGIDPTECVVVANLRGAAEVQVAIAPRYS